MTTITIHNDSADMQPPQPPSHSVPLMPTNTAPGGDQLHVFDEEPNKHFINDDEGFDVAISDKGCHEKSYLEEQRNDDIGSQGAKSPMRRSCLVPGSDQNIKGVFFPTWQNCSANEKQFCIFLREKNSIRLWLLIVFHFGTVNWEEK